MKDETGGKPITEFVGLRSKLYSYIVDDKHKFTCKGVKKYAAKRYLKHEDYKNVLFNRTTKNVSQNGIRSYNHNIYTETVNKVALSSKSDKEFILDDNINTLSFGHYKIKSILN